MKYKTLFPGIICFTVLFSAAFISGCKKDDASSSECTAKTTNAPRSINFFDIKAGSPYFNQVVASFKFNQGSTSYSGGTGCPISECSTTLSIQNITAKKITFDYNIIFTLNFVQWNYQGIAVIDAGATINVGEINASCTSLTLGQIVLQSASITYQ